jgi:hypothetical protein
MWDGRTNKWGKKIIPSSAFPGTRGRDCSTSVRRMALDKVQPAKHGRILIGTAGPYTSRPI